MSEHSDLEVDFGQFHADLQALSYPVAAAELREQYGDRELGYREETATLRAALAGVEDDYEGAAEVRDAVDDLIGDAVGGTADEAADGAVDGTADEAVDGAVDGTADEAVDGAVDGTTDEAVDGAVDGTTDEAADGAADEVVADRTGSDDAA